VATHDDVRKTTRAHRDRILALPGVTGIFTGEKTRGGEKTGEVAVVVTVAKKRPLSDVPTAERVPATLDGHPTDVIEEVFRAVLDTTRYDPLEGGSSVGIANEIHYGTIGLVVTDVATGKPMTLSNWHVYLREGNGDIGEPLVQPSFDDGGVYPDDWVGDVERFVLSEKVDGAVSFVRGRGVSRTIASFGDITGIAAATVSESVKKHGRTSGTTVGTVSAIDYSGDVLYPDYPGGPLTAHFVEVIRFTGDPGTVLPGDSGSILVDADGVTAVGLCHGANGDGSVCLACHIADVFSELGIELYAGPVLSHAEEIEASSASGWDMSATVQLAEGMIDFALGICTTQYNLPENLNMSGISMWGLAYMSAVAPDGSLRAPGSAIAMIGVEGSSPSTVFTMDDFFGWTPNVDVFITMHWEAGTITVTATQGETSFTASASGDTAMPADSYIFAGDFGIYFGSSSADAYVTIRDFTFSTGS
jgi:hypothetical protein